MLVTQMSHEEFHVPATRRRYLNNNLEQITVWIQEYIQSNYPAEYHGIKYVINSTN
jgi:hypothetical protein